MSPKLFLSILGWAVMWGAASLPAQNQIKTSVIANGGGKSANSSFRLLSTVGQPFIGPSSRENQVVVSGFWSQQVGVVTGVEQVESDGIPQEFRLEQNYPNPFNPSTTIEFAVPNKSQVKIKLYDLLGREVATLVDELYQPGTYKVVFEAGSLPSGLYIYRIEAEGFTKARKLMLLK